MALDLSGLQAEVAALDTVTASVLALIDGLVAKLNAAAGDPAAIAAITAQLGVDRQRIADAVSANTPAA